jgi:hypothetical protein
LLCAICSIGYLAYDKALPLIQLRQVIRNTFSRISQKEWVTIWMEEFGNQPNISDLRSVTNTGHSRTRLNHGFMLSGGERVSIDGSFAVHHQTDQVCTKTQLLFLWIHQ